MHSSDKVVPFVGLIIIITIMNSLA